MQNRKNESKIKPHLENLLEMKKHNKSLGIMQSYLQEQGVIIKSTSTISRYLDKNSTLNNNKTLYEKHDRYLKIRCYVENETLKIFIGHKPFLSRPIEMIIDVASIKDLCQ